MEFARLVGVDTSDVEVTVTAGSGNVEFDFTVFVPNKAQQTTLKESVEAKATEEFESALNVTVEAAPIVAAVTTSPLSAPPSQPTDQSDSLADGTSSNILADGTSSNIGAIAGGAGRSH